MNSENIIHSTATDHLPGERERAKRMSIEYQVIIMRKIVALTYFVT